ncbi:tRNA (adenosine(37)-N6)-threonylcarbamoyltransferase complex ATPase subunit type 1 TsaE [Lentisphaera profundi]|uniref:tRNA threonylcarbamoyladenosine biosynthesis protein TsaE n=1 Tax=Lentisphaera profundi TaxID=1658616 RepID=A0ABY7VXX0_9BACT|nr:tRNA (adenosine(37)-N6)-threonylcarbamoyltransferase complex ATPase subunit type 1 TsaE [Lentisphaera profundi]WDE98123.1 tRNA (adenosine(37)-N6)-threonylcarbamoyltransferase complex ATPase subunit type 1 TsaE [Lentisphaera profundi]
MISNSEQETATIAADFAKTVNCPSVITLCGDLGAGKSCFARAFLQSLGVKGPITSPTFSLVNLYQSENGVQLAHMDLYRLEDDEQAYQAGIEEILHDSNTISLVEWPERLSWMLPKDILQIKITHQSETSRLIELPESSL